MGPQWLGHPDCRDPVILAGDFNALPSGRTCRLLAAKLGGSESADLLDENLATFPSRAPMLGIDHVFASPSVELLGAEVIRTRLARMASDHLPLKVNFRLRNRAGKHVTPSYGRGRQNAFRYRAANGW